MTCKCIKQLIINRYDEDCRHIEDEYLTVKIGEEFKIDLTASWLGGNNIIHLQQGMKWIEISDETFKEHFVIIEH